MSGPRNEGLEAAALWHDKQARIYALDTEALSASNAAEARIDKYVALANEHRASAAIFRGMMSA